MVEKAKKFIPDFVKDGYKKAVEPLGKAEKAIENARENLMKNFEKLDTAELKKVFDDLLAKVRTARGEVEQAVSTGLTKTWHALNVPTQREVNVIKADVAHLSREVRALKGPSKKAAKKAPKKAAKKGR